MNEPDFVEKYVATIQPETESGIYMEDANYAQMWQFIGLLIFSIMMKRMVQSFWMWSRRIVVCLMWNIAETQIINEILIYRTCWRTSCKNIAPLIPLRTFLENDVKTKVCLIWTAGSPSKDDMEWL